MVLDPQAIDSACPSEHYLFGPQQMVSRQLDLHGGSPQTSQMRARVGTTPDAWDSWWLSFLKGGVSQSLEGRPREVTVIDLFSSAGGLSLGVREAARALNMRFQPLMAVDLDFEALVTYRANFAPSVIANRSVRELVDYQVLGRGEDAELTYTPQAIGPAKDFKGVDVIVGGPPCQGHSSLNNHTRGDDLRNDLYLTLPALAIALEAKTVIIENVPRVVKDRQKVVASTVQLLSQAGYCVTTGVLSASSMGWPQTRTRHFLVASRMAPVLQVSDVGSALERRARPVWWAIEDLAEHSLNESPFESVPRMSKENVERISYLFETGSYDLPNHIRPDCHKDGHTYPSVYGRLLPDEPAPTITTGFQTPGRGRFIHPTERRVLTAHEAARIQGFPDSFRFVSSGGEVTRSQLQKWIGDAVPSILGYAAGLLALSTLR